MPVTLSAHVSPEGCITDLHLSVTDQEISAWSAIVALASVHRELCSRLVNEFGLDCFPALDECSLWVATPSGELGWPPEDGAEDDSIWPPSDPYRAQEPVGPDFRAEVLEAYVGLGFVAGHRCECKEHIQIAHADSIPQQRPCRRCWVGFVELRDVTIDNLWTVIGDLEVLGSALSSIAEAP